MLNSDLPFAPLIGHSIEVRNSPNICEMGISGSVIDETKNTLLISSCGKEVVVPKFERTFAVISKNGESLVFGSSIMFRPEEKAKRLR